MVTLQGPETVPTYINLGLQTKTDCFVMIIQTRKQEEHFYDASNSEVVYKPAYFH